MTKLSPTQLNGLDRFASPGGNGFGEYANLSCATAFALARAGLIVIGSYWDHSTNRSRTVAYVTQAGVDALNAAKPWAHPKKFYGTQYVVPGWSPWKTIPSTRRGGESIPQTATLNAAV